MNNVHPTAVIGAGVELGENNIVGPYTVILGPARLGDDNWIGPHVVIGTPGEISGIDHGRGFDGGVGSGIRIGSRNVVREFTTIHQGHFARTTLGDDCYLMNKVYLGHDDVIGDGVTIAAGTMLGGHVHVGAGANLGMGVTVHQRRVVGPTAMIGMAAVVTRDIPPYALAYGNPARVQGANQVGMRRAGLPESAIAAIEAAYTAAGGPGELPRDWAEPGTWCWWDAETGPAV
jgi:UDP-N-acetylglucosamine acyltransferase